MLSSDKPILSKRDDILRRTSFSKQLAEAILAYTKSDNFVLSLCGRWGSGKTSIINLVVEEIESITKEDEEESKPIIVRFNPWNYADSTQLMHQFFTILSETLKTKDKCAELRKIGEALDGYSSLFEYTQYIPIIGTFIAPLNKSIKTSGSLLKSKAEKLGSLEARKRAVIDALEKQKHKIIIIIDDIDRLNNAQIRSIFQLVNSVAGFPNMIYFLSFDRNVVSRALQDEQNCNGEEYLEKIIQVPFEVPEANRQLISKAFVERFATIVDMEKNDIDTDYWQKIYSNCVYPFLKGIRDVNRILNTYEFKYDLMHNEINAIDLLVITTLQTCAPDISDWIRRNSASLVGGVESQGAISGVEQKQNVEHYKNLFLDIFGNKSELAMRVLQNLFPKFAWITGGYNRSGETNDELRRDNKVSSSERIERYFNLSLEDIPVGQEEIQLSINLFSGKQLLDFLKRLLDEDKMDYYLQELIAHIQDIPSERVELFIRTLCEIQKSDKMYNRGTILYPRPSAECMNIIKELFKINDKKANKILLLDLINNGDKKSAYVLAEVIEFLEVVHGRKGRYVNEVYQFIELDDLKEIESAYISLLDKVIDNLFEAVNIDTLFSLWGDLDKNKRDNHIKKMLKDEINIPKFPYLKAGTWHGANGLSGWFFDEHIFSEFITGKEVYEGICKLKNTRFKELTKSQQEIAIAYVIWYETVDKEAIDNRIDKARVEPLIQEWI